jgi:hypothetical protein
MNLFIRSAIIRKIMLIMTLASFVCIFPCSLNAAPANPDTTCSVSFRLNMTKAVNQHIFMPDSDFVYLLMDHEIQPLRLVPGPGYIYSGTLLGQLDSGVSYHYKFSVNAAPVESVTRTVTAQPGLINVSAWWNNEPLNISSFIVNMKYAVQYGMFDPLSDSVFIVGTMNNSQGPPRMERIDTTLNYAWVDTLLDPGSVQQYKYRINADSAGLELLYKPARIVRIPDTLFEVASDFNNFNPAKRLMTFQCDMGYYVKAHHFDVIADYLDVAGNFNGNGANDVLFDVDGDTIYTVETYLDTAWIHQGPLAFKYRINGDQNAMELSGKPDRTYVFHDTINHNPNISICFFNNLDPSVPTPPWVYNVDIQGLLIYKKFLSGIYSYENVNGIPEGNSTYRWLRSANPQGTDATPIDSAWKITYVVDTLDIGKWLVFEVTPQAVSGDSAAGKPVLVVSSNSISAWDVGMGDYSGLITQIYPNPVSDYVSVVAKREIEKIELINYLNQTVLVKNNISSTSLTLPVGYLPRGLYLLKATTKTGQFGVVRMIKR